MPWRGADARAIDEFLQLLARAVQQFHTYPPTSPMCQSAVDACQRSLVLLAHRDHVAFRVAPRDLVVDEVPVGQGTLVEQELARRLHSASIAQVSIDRAASARELSRFCYDLVCSGDRTGNEADLIERLKEHGVDRIALSPAYRPEVLEIVRPSAPIEGVIETQRERREELLAGGGGVNHLYPPDKGWVRVDPSLRFSNVSLIDLALLADDPATLATMLLRLTDDGAPESGADALTQKFSDVAALFAALDPRVARVMFSKLAQAVLDLDPERRQTLLRRTILPGLLDGRVDGTVLRDFPDLDLAESLCLLLDLETAAPEVVTTALARLDLSTDRHSSVMPLIEERLNDRSASRRREAGLDAHARKLIHVDRDRAASFAEFASFDLSLDGDAIAVLGQIRDGIAAVDVMAAQLECLWNLAHLEPNPELAQRFVDRALPLLEALERASQFAALASWLSRYRHLADALREARPDVADIIAGRLAGFCTSDRALRVVELAARDGADRAAAGAIVQALGPAIGSALLSAMQSRSPDGKDQRIRAAVQLLCDHAVLVAPALVEALGTADTAAMRTVARVLGLAGSGYEAPLAALLATGDEQTVREALRSLARIGTSRAATLVVVEIEKSPGWIGGAAEQTLWHFPKPEADRQVRDLLSRRDFVLRHPQIAARLLDRAAQGDISGLQPVLQGLLPLRYRLWNPALVRVGRKAGALLRR